MRQCHATAGRAHDFQLGRRRFAARDGVERARGAGRVSAYRLIDALGHNRVADGIDRIVQSIQLVPQRRPLRGCWRRVEGGEKIRGGIRIVFHRVPLSPQLQPVHHIVRGDRFDRFIGVRQLSAKRRDFAEA